MDKRQNAKLSSYQRVQSFDTEYAAELKSIDDYADLQKGFDGNVKAINTAAQQQQVTEGVTEDVLDDAKENMAETVVEFASRGTVKAQINGNAELANRLDKPVTYIFRADKNVAVLRAQEIRDVMNDNLGVLTNISAEDIENVDAAIEAYNDIKDKPVINVQHKKSQGTGVLPGLFKAADAALDKMLRLVTSYFFRKNAPMVDELKLAMQIINTGIRHTIVNIKTVDAAGVPLAGVDALEPAQQKTYISDEEGLIHIDRHESGHTTFTFSKPGYQSVTAGLDIKRGTDNGMTVHLVAV